MRPTSRLAAIEILCLWEKTGQPVDQVRDEWLQRYPLLDARDRHLAMAIVYGVLRQRGYLDSIVSRFSRHSLAKMQARIRQALRVGLFQLLFLDRIPPAIAIHETVQALKATRQPVWLTGFVNATLRTIDRERAGLPEPDAVLESSAEFGLLNHPLWLVKRWEERYGQEIAYQICRHNNQAPDLCLMINLSLTTVAEYLAVLAAQGITAEPGQYATTAVRLPGFRGLIQEIPGYDEGFFQVQDEAAQLVTQLLAPFPPGQYLDGCAGLGGKTGQLAAALPAAARIVAVEPDSGRLTLLKQNLARLKLRDRVEIVQARLEELRDRYCAAFSGVLIDAPCTGIGVIRRQPDIRWSRQSGDFKRYQERQLALLTAAAGMVQAGGVLVYATCSTEPEENEQVIEMFLQSFPEFALTDCRDCLPETARGLADTQGFLRTLPVDGLLDGFFAARLLRKNV
jgi:16S rRNA (cytosine967-C5)-methyltransferase